MTSPLDESRAAIQQIRNLVSEVGKDPNHMITKDTVSLVRQGLVNLRRCHAKLRISQGEKQAEAIEAVKRLRSTRSESENASFTRAQCEMLVNKYNTSQSPEFEKLLPSLPTVEAYSASHQMDEGFVPYEVNPHQFMLNLLADELSDRKQMEEHVQSLAEKRALVEKEIVEKKKFLESIGTRLVELSRSVDTIKEAFGHSSDKGRKFVPNADKLESRELIEICERFSSAEHVSVSVPDNGKSVIIKILQTASMMLPPASNGSATLTFHDTGDVTCTPTMDRIDPSHRPADIVASIRARLVSLAWNNYEDQVLSRISPLHSETLPMVPLDVMGVGMNWLVTDDYAPGNGFRGLSKVTKVGNKEAGNCEYTVIFCVASVEYVMKIKPESKTVIITKSADGITLVSSIADDEYEGKAVDAQLAAAAETVSEWWRRRANLFRGSAIFPPGQISSVIFMTVKELLNSS